VGGSVNLAATLVDSSSNPISGALITLTLAPNSPGPQSCSATTNGSGVASCTINPVTVDDGIRGVTASYAGNGGYVANSTSATITVNPQPADNLTYTGDTIMTNGASATVSARLTDALSNGLSGRLITFTLAPAGNAQQCTGTTDSNGNASCVITSVNETPGSRIVHVAFGGDTYPANSVDAVVTVNNGPQDTLTYSGSALTSGQSGILRATLTDSVSGNPIVGQPVELTLAPAGVDQDCTGTTNGSGVASCSIGIVQAAAGTYNVVATFGGGGGYPANQTTTPLAVNVGPADTISYTGDTSFTNGTSGHLSMTLTNASNGNPIVGATVTLSLAPADNNQDCTGVTNGSGHFSCTITSVNESDGAHIVRANFGSGLGYPANQLDTPVSVTG